MDSPSASQILAECSQQDTPLTQPQEIELRQFYLSIVNHPDLSFQDKMRKLKSELMDKYGDLMNYKPINPKAVIISYYPECDHQPKIKYLLEKNFLTLGQWPENDINLTDLKVSRIHCLIAIFQEKIVILDFWSLNGTFCLKIQANQKVDSYSGHRKVIILDRKEKFLLSIGEHQRIFNPGTCRECLSRPCQVRLNCGHMILCHYCYRHYLEGKFKSDDTCPKCLKKIKKSVRGPLVAIYHPDQNLYSSGSNLSSSFDWFSEDLEDSQSDELMELISAQQPSWSPPSREERKRKRLNTTRPMESPKDDNSPGSKSNLSEPIKPNPSDDEIAPARKKRKPNSQPRLSARSRSEFRIHDLTQNLNLFSPKPAEHPVLE